MPALRASASRSRLNWIVDTYPPVDVDAEQRHSCGSHSADPSRLTQRGRPQSGEFLDDLVGEARNAGVVEPAGDAPPGILPDPLHLPNLLLDVAAVLHAPFDQ